ncbi:hypothetical protein L596_022720 [Steinernema carpocapsae]|uniref:Uncharacterized protein n=1 Tax=Steinernema carpocapsae TaxID=34508 RepID=A0A4U5MMM6_STECR|nr:hypothetical protein L596_022720 [Steinernema carpocapsae]
MCEKYQGESRQDQDKRKRLQLGLYQSELKSVWTNVQTPSGPNHTSLRSPPHFIKASLSFPMFLIHRLNKTSQKIIVSATR